MAFFICVKVLNYIFESRIPTGGIDINFDKFNKQSLDLTNSGGTIFDDQRSVIKLTSLFER